MRRRSSSEPRLSSMRSSSRHSRRRLIRSRRRNCAMRMSLFTSTRIVGLINQPSSRPGTLSVKIAGVRIDLNVDQGRALSLKGTLQCLVDIARPRDLNSDRSKSASDVEVRNSREADAGRFTSTQELAERFHCAVAMVVQDNHDHGKLLLYGGPKGLNGVHGRAVSDEADYRLFFGERDSNGRRKPPAQSSTGHRVKTFGSEYREMLLHCGPVRGCFLDDN